VERRFRRSRNGRGKEKAYQAGEDQKHVVSASQDNPEYLVESDKTGALAAHKAAALKPVRKNR
jgi:hypothetical protein